MFIFWSFQSQIKCLFRNLQIGFTVIADIYSRLPPPFETGKAVFSSNYTVGWDHSRERYY